MDEYIERDAVIDLITRRYENPEICTQEINSIPAADVVPVVRCKDCKYAGTKRESVVEKRYAADILFCRNSDLCGDEPLAMWPDDFCSYGEPKEG